MKWNPILNTRSILNINQHFQLKSNFFKQLYWYIIQYYIIQWKQIFKKNKWLKTLGNEQKWGGWEDCWKHRAVATKDSRPNACLECISSLWEYTLNFLKLIIPTKLQHLQMFHDYGPTVVWTQHLVSLLHLFTVLDLYKLHCGIYFRHKNPLGHTDICQLALF